jgi:ankyrin repeat protein
MFKYSKKCFVAILLSLFAFSASLCAVSKLELQNFIKEYEASDTNLTPLRYAVEQDFDEIAVFYAKEHYDDSHPSIAIQIIRKGKISLLKRFLDINKKDSNVHERISIDYQKYRAQIHFSIKVCDLFEKRNALMIAIEELSSPLDLEVTKLLVEYGADLNDIDFHTLAFFNNNALLWTYKINPLGAALYYNKWEIAMYLISRGAQNLRACYFETDLGKKLDEKSYQTKGYAFDVEPLAFSIEKGNLEMAELLMNHSYSPNGLEIAIKNNNIEAVNLLLSYGFKPSISHVHLALNLGFYDIADLITDILVY